MTQRLLSDEGCNQRVNKKKGKHKHFTNDDHHKGCKKKYKDSPRNSSRRSEYLKTKHFPSREETLRRKEINNLDGREKEKEKDDKDKKKGNCILLCTIMGGFPMRRNMFKGTMKRKIA